MQCTLTEGVRELLLLDKHQILKGNEDWGSGLVLDIDPKSIGTLFTCSESRPIRDAQF